MQDQALKLRRTPWNVLVILDACRSDAAAARLNGVETVRSPAWITYAWIHWFAAHFGRERILYVTANPVVNRELSRREHSFVLLSVWKDRWGRYGPHGMPSVHPRDVNLAVREYLARHGQPRRMVVHYLQPHVPYIGTGSIPYSGWGRGMTDPLSRAFRELTSVEDAFARGLVSAERLRRAYAGNVDLVLPWTRRLLAAVKGMVALTSDHGELLGEDGRYGHSRAHPLLHLVPWRVWQRGTFDPQPVCDLAEDEDSHVHRKLRSLGYE
jgi:hypothetical protein